MRTWPYWPMARATSEPSTAISVSVRVRSCPEIRKDLGFPTSHARAAPTIAANGSPGMVAGEGRPSDANMAEDADSMSDQFRRQSSAQDRPNGHHSATATTSPRTPGQATDQAAD